MMPILLNVLKHVPTNHIVKDVQVKEKGIWQHRYSTHLLQYDKVKMLNNITGKLIDIKVVIKLIEGIQYPKNWQNNPKVEGNVKREVIFYSCYFK